MAGTGSLSWLISHDTTECMKIMDNAKCMVYMYGMGQSCPPLIAVMAKISRDETRQEHRYVVGACVLLQELEAQHGRDGEPGIAVLPTIRINHVQYRGTLEHTIQYKGTSGHTSGNWKLTPVGASGLGHKQVWEQPYAS
eukprot:1150277-Pelagomonas_calceolata.AAC.4